MSDGSSVCLVVPCNWIQIMHVWQELHRINVVSSLVHHIRKHMVIFTVITWLRLCLPSFLYCRVSVFFPFVLDRYLVETYFEILSMFFPNHNFSVNLLIFSVKKNPIMVFTKWCFPSSVISSELCLLKSYCKEDVSLLYLCFCCFPVSIDTWILILFFGL